MRWTLLLCVLVMLAAACGEDRIEVDDVAASTQSSDPSEPIERPDLDAVDASIVRIIGFGCGAPALGSGFAIEQNLVVTSGHIVTGRDADSLAVMRSNGEEYSATLVGFDQHLDLAVLRVDDTTFTPVHLVTTVPRVDGVAIGIRSFDDEPFLNEIDFTVDAPVNVNWDGVFRDTESRYRGLRINAEVSRGDSGSGLFINDRDVIGLIHSTNRAGLPRAYAVGSIEIAAFMEIINPAVEVVAERCA